MDLLKIFCPKKMVEVGVLCNAILKLPVVYANLIVDELSSRHIHEHPHDYEEMGRPRTCGFLDMEKEIIVINSFAYDN